MFLSNRQLRIKEVLVIIFLILGLNLLIGCDQQKPESKPPETTPGFLTITGNGVERPTEISLAELKDMEEATVGECYSAVNNWPARKFYVAKGVRVEYLLEMAGIKEDARTIMIEAADGYSASFTREQLEEKRYCYPQLLEGRDDRAREVPAILAWEYREGSSDLSEAVPGKLILLLGQKGLKDVVAPVFVKDVVKIEVSISNPGSWDEVQAEPAAGKLARGAEVVLKHPQLDQIKIYYTLDGSTPDERSILYNPSTSYFQPELIKPVKIKQSLLIKAVAIGCGKYNSPVASFKYEVE